MTTPKRPKTINAAAVSYAPISLVGELEITAAAGEQKAPTFKMLAYTGGLLRLAGWAYPVVVKLAGMTVPSQRLPVRLQHDAQQGVGHTTRIAKTGSQLTAEGVISRDTVWAQDVINSHKNGFPWQVSMGAVPDGVVLVAENQTVKANGQTFDGPVYLVAESTLSELSFVDLGADTHTSAAIAAQTKKNENHPSFGEHVMKIKDLRVLAHAHGQHLDKDILETAILAAAEADEDKETFIARLEAMAADKKPSAQQTPPDTEPLQAAGISAAEVSRLTAEATKAAIAAEHLRQRTIRTEAAGLGITAESVETLIANPEMNIEAARGEMLKAIRAQRTNAVSGAPAGIVIDKAIGIAMVLEAAAYLACQSVIGGSDEKALKHYGAPTLEAAGKFRQLGVQDMFRIAAAAEGKTLPMVSEGSGDFIRAAFSVSSLPGILSNLANKALLEGYLYGEEEWRKVCGVGSTRDFKKHTRYRLGADMMYKKVGPGGELKHGQLTEQSFEQQVDTHGVMIGLTRQMIINDDLAAFASLPFELGLGANDAINAAVWALLESNPSSFFGTDNKNLPTAGASNALSFEALTIAEKAFLDQTKPNGRPLGVRPSTLLVPTALKALAEMLMQSPIIENTPGGLTQTNKAKPVTNIHAAKWQVAYSAYLTSATSWYMLADPNRMAAMEVAFLNGVDRPTVETGQPNFDTLGIQMRAYLDFGVAMQDPRAAVKMTIA